MIHYRLRFRLIALSLTRKQARQLLRGDDALSGGELLCARWRGGRIWAVGEGRLEIFVDRKNK